MKLRTLNITLLIIALLLKGPFVQAQDVPLKFKHLSLNDGLKNLLIHSITQDYQGFIWIGTEDGLHKFDGYRFTVYYNNPNDSNSLKDNNINEIIEDNSKQLWIGTNAGLELFNRETNSFIHIPVVYENLNQVRKICNYYINYLYRDKEHNIYVGTRQQILLKVDKQNKCVRPFCNNIRFEENMVRASDKHGNIWISSRHGAYKFNTKTQEVVHFTADDKNSQSIASNQVFFIHVDKDDNVWIATDEGLNKIDGKTRKISCYIHKPNIKGSIPGYFINKIYEDKFGNLWFSGDYGLFRYNKTQDDFSLFSYSNNGENSLSTNKIPCSFVDKQGIIWVGTLTNGIDYAPLANPLNFETVHTNTLFDNKIEPSPVKAIFKDNEDNLWIGTDGVGLFCINLKTGKKKLYKYDPLVSSTIRTNSILAIMQDSNGDMWFGGYYGGINKLNKSTQKFESFSLNTKKPISVRNFTYEITRIIEGRDHNLIISTNGGGLVLFDKVTRSFNFIINEPGNRNSLCSNWCITLYKDSNGIIWIGTYNGLCRWNPVDNSFTNFQHNNSDPKSIAGNIIYSICEDSNHEMWIGTTKGLCKLNKIQQFECYTVKDGFPSEVINGVLKDSKDNIWVSTFQGISRFNPTSKSIKNYNADYGLQSSQFIGSGCYKDNLGNLYFCSLDGYTKFNPEEIRDYQYKSPLYITDFKILNKTNQRQGNSNLICNPTSEPKRIELNYRQSFIFIKYVALNYLYPGQAQYAYILEGFEKDWHFVGSERTATYTNLAPGKYTFKVKLCDEQGANKDTSTEIQLIIHPPIWQTIWAYIFYAILLVLTIIGVIKFSRYKDSIKQQLEIQRIEANEQHKLDMVKLQFFTNISHELRTPLTLILGPAERLLHSIQNNLKPEASLADTIYRNSNRLLRLVNQLLDFRKLDSGKEELILTEGNIVQFVQNIFELFRSQAEFKEIEFKIDSQSPIINTKFDQDKIEKVICNLLSNAIKFTPNHGIITLSIREINSKDDNAKLKEIPNLAERYTMIQVSDTGPGIDDSEKTKIFDSFYQANNSLLTKQEGTGIGLAITKDYISMHHGIIFVNDNVDNEKQAVHGSIFVVYLPLLTSNANNTIQSGQSNPHPVLNDNYIGEYFTQGEKSNTVLASDTSDETPLLLIVEDNPDMRNFIRIELTDQYRIIEAGNGKDGVRSALSNIPDLIISDIMMPDISGLQLCKKIKTDLRTSHIPVIILTALSEDEYKIEGLETGADDYLIKPFNAGILKARIKNLIDTRKQLQEKFSQSVGFTNKAAAHNSTDQKFLEKLVSIVNQELENPDIDIQLFIRELGMSKTLLYKKIKALTGQSLFEFIYTIRLKKAAEILLNENTSVSEVATRVGFSNLSVFTRSFTRKFNINPSKYASIYNPQKKQS